MLTPLPNRHIDILALISESVLLIISDDLVESGRYLIAIAVVSVHPVRSLRLMIVAIRVPHSAIVGVPQLNEFDFL